MKTASHMLVAILVSFVLISSGHAEGKGKLSQQKQKTRLNNNKNENSRPRKAKPSSTNTATPVQRLSAITGQNVAVDRLKASDADDDYAKLKGFVVEMRLADSWEKFFTPVPTSLGILSTLITMTADLTNDFPLNYHDSPIGGFDYIKHADSFHLSLFQISQESYQAFLCAQNNMNRIRLSTLTIPSYMRAALDILDTEDIELIHTRLHLPLTVVQKSINSNVKWSSEVMVAFERLVDLTIEVHLAAESLLPIQTIRKEKLDKNKGHDELKGANLKLVLDKQKKQVEQDLAKQNQADEDLLKAQRSVPTGIDRFFMDVAQFFTGSTRELLSKEETGKAFDHLIRQQNGPSNRSTSHDPCIYNNILPITTIQGRSELLLNDYKNLSSIDSIKGKYNATEDAIFYRNLLLTNNASLKCQPLEKVIEMGCKTIELIHELAHATIESMPKEAQQNLPLTEKDSKTIFNNWRNTQFQEIRESMVRFNENATLLVNIVSRGKEVITDQFHGNFTHSIYSNKSNRHSEWSTANAYHKIDSYTEWARILKEKLDNTKKQIMTTTIESIRILNEIRSWKTEEIDLKRAIEILKLGLEDVNKIKENWILLARFFTKLSQIIEDTLRKSLLDFIKQLNTMTSTPSFKKKKDVQNLVIKQIRDKTVRANQVLTLVHEMSSTYYHISKDYLMPRVHRLDFLMNISNGNSSNMDSERNRFIQACENDVITIQRLIFDEKQRLMEKLNATVRQIVERNRRFLQIN